MADWQQPLCGAVDATKPQSRTNFAARGRTVYPTPRMPTNGQGRLKLYSITIELAESSRYCTSGNWLNTMSCMPGEAMHVLGADGSHRAKLWLEATTRVKAAWLNTDPNAAGRLEFDWPHGGTTYSFDVGGILHGGDLSGQMFVVESKKYSGDSDQGGHYRSYLAKCYVTRRDYGRLADQFMWITWHPFNVKTWDALCSEDKVIEGVLSEYSRVFGTQSEEEAKALLDRDLVKDVADRLWLLVLSDKQEQLVISKKHRALITAHEIENGS